MLNSKEVGIRKRIDTLPVCFVRFWKINKTGSIKNNTLLLTDLVILLAANTILRDKQRLRGGGEETTLCSAKDFIDSSVKIVIRGRRDIKVVIFIHILDFILKVKNSKIVGDI